MGLNVIMWAGCGLGSGSSIYVSEIPTGSDPEEKTFIAHIYYYESNQLDRGLACLRACFAVSVGD